MGRCLMGVLLFNDSAEQPLRMSIPWDESSIASVVSRPSGRRVTRQLDSDNPRPSRSNAKMNWKGVKCLCIALVGVMTLGEVTANGVEIMESEIERSAFEHRHLKAKTKVEEKAQAETFDPRPAFMLFGDSITQFGMDVEPKGWGARLEQAYVRSVDVINRGLSAYNTTNFVNLVLPVATHEIATQFKPVFMTLWLGTNDAALIGGPSDYQHVPVEEYTANLVLILTKFHELAPQTKILVITPGVVDDDARRRAFGGGRLDRSNAQSKIYAAACVEATKDLPGVTALDLHSYLMSKYPDSANRAKLLGDGLHLSMEGNDVVYNLISKQIRELLPSKMLQMPQFPYF